MGCKVAHCAGHISANITHLLSCAGMTGKWKLLSLKFRGSLISRIFNRSQNISPNIFDTRRACSEFMKLFQQNFQKSLFAKILTLKNSALYGNRPRGYLKSTYSHSFLSLTALHPCSHCLLQTNKKLAMTWGESTAGVIGNRCSGMVRLQYHSN